jgi:hypothetical protein
VVQPEQRSCSIRRQLAGRHVLGLLHLEHKCRWRRLLHCAECFAAERHTAIRVFECTHFDFARPELQSLDRQHPRVLVRVLWSRVALLSFCVLP